MNARYPRSNRRTLVLLAGALLAAHVHAETVAPPRPRKPRAQPPVPEGMKEVPYREDAPPPPPTAAEQARGFVVFTRPITQPIYAVSVPRAEERTEGLAAFAAPGEYEPATFALYALRNLSDVRVSVSELRSPDAAIAPDHLDLRLVTEWNIHYPDYNSRGAWRRMPELLEKVDAVDIPGGECRRFWLRLHVPEQARPGLYRGAFTIAAANGAETVLPLTLRVGSFSLSSDPRKKYSAFAPGYGPQLGHVPKELRDRAVRNELEEMRAYGLDMFPNFGLSEKRLADGSFEVRVHAEERLAMMLDMGFQGPIPVSSGFGGFYRHHVPGGTIGGHGKWNKLPEGDAMYRDIEQAYRDFRVHYAAKGYPELICRPIDEPDATAASYVAKVYAAIRAAGVRTYITKDPLAGDADIYRQANAVDAWCGQPFSMPYAKATTDPRYEYWSYPNKVVAEVKDHAVLLKGGRMTYGFGFWKSGYTALFTWHWRWQPNNNPFDYLAGQSGCGHRIDEQGEFIPALIWECLREGRDDLRYLYTLQQAVYDREHSATPACRALVRQARELVQEVWDLVPAVPSYVPPHTFDDYEFDALRWRMARLTEELLRHPAARRGPSPSVLADTSRQPPAPPDRLVEAEKQGRLERRDLGGDFSAWRAAEAEAKVSVIATDAHPVLRLTVAVDHTRDAAGKTDGKHLAGWPRALRQFAPGEVPLADCDYLVFRYRIDSNRDEVADDHTPILVGIYSHEGGSSGFKGETKLDFGDLQREWRTLRLSIPDLIAQSGRPPARWQSLRQVFFTVCESDYRDGTRLQLDFDRIELVKAKAPVLESITASTTLLLPSPAFPVAVSGLGMSRTAGYELALTLAAAQRVVAQSKAPLSAEARHTLDAAAAAPGVYDLRAEVVDATGRKVSVLSKRITAIPGFAP
ncbi:MAG: hypothetical protein JXR37_15260 [Kiritimatiellae bacterium]|nr:hypothetical protein [Kiritimatiellia bacterium]